MKQLLIICSAFIFSLNAKAQRTDTITARKQKGFLFLSTHNFQYDYHGEESRPLGFHDFFFPIDKFDTALITSQAKQVVFKNGLRVDFINNRQPLKDKALLLKGTDTSGCYEYDQFYIIPVAVSYKMFDDYEPFVCRRNYFDIQITNGGTLHFEYEHKAIAPFEILVNSPQNNCKKQKKPSSTKSKNSTQSKAEIKVHESRHLSEYTDSSIMKS